MRVLMWNGSLFRIRPKTANIRHSPERAPDRTPLRGMADIFWGFRLIGAVTGAVYPLSVTGASDTVEEVPDPVLLDHVLRRAVLLEIAAHDGTVGNVKLAAGILSGHSGAHDQGKISQYIAEFPDLSRIRFNSGTCAGNDNGIAPLCTQL